MTELVTHSKLSLKSSVFVRQAADMTTDLDKMIVYLTLPFLNWHEFFYEHLIFCPEEQMTEVMLSSVVEVTSDVT